MRKKEIVEKLREHGAELEALGIESLSIFGSVARDEADQNSDVDALVQLSEPRTFRKYMQARIFLEDLLGRKVDLVTIQAVRPQILPFIEKDLISVT